VGKNNSIIFSVDQQLELMAERFASLPKGISPSPVYRQMEKLEVRKKDAMAALAKLRDTGVIKDEPASLRDFERFLRALREMLQESAAANIKARVIRALVKRVVITSEGFEVHFKVGENYVKSFIASESSAKSSPERKGANIGQKKGAGSVASGPAEKNMQVACSNTCINGGRERDHSAPHGPRPFGARAGRL
jgi:hypothetical protein